MRIASYQSLLGGGMKPHTEGCKAKTQTKIRKIDTRLCNAMGGKQCSYKYTARTRTKQEGHRQKPHTLKSAGIGHRFALARLRRYKHSEQSQPCIFNRFYQMKWPIKMPRHLPWVQDMLAAQLSSVHCASITFLRQPYGGTQVHGFLYCVINK